MYLTFPGGSASTGDSLMHAPWLGEGKPQSNLAGISTSLARADLIKEE
jgi:hypothetical protein